MPSAAACEGDLDHLLARRHGERRPGAQACDPDPVEAAEFDDAVGECRRDDDGEAGADRALIVLQLVEPARLPVRGVLGLPDDRSAQPQCPVAHLVHDVGAARALAHRCDQVVRKAAGEFGLDIDFEHLALALLRALLALAPGIVERAAQIVYQLVLFLEFQLLLLGKAAAQRLEPLSLGIDPARHFEIERAGELITAGGLRNVRRVGSTLQHDSRSAAVIKPRSEFGMSSSAEEMPFARPVIGPSPLRIAWRRG